MPTPQTASYGSWKSPITADLIVAHAIGFMDIALDGDDVYWSEMRPTEGGRYVVVRLLPEGQKQDLTPPGFNARTRVHEYGGAAFLVDEGVVYFSNFADQRLYRQSPNGEPEVLTPEGYRYADGVADRARGRIIYVREDHTQSDREAVNTISAVDLDSDGTGGRVLVSGHDFYSAPRLSPDGKQLAWLAWNHPEMPWTKTQLWLGDVDVDGQIVNVALIAGSDESVTQPSWSPDGVLHFVSDRSGWWNLYRWQDDEAQSLAPLDAEFGVPQWVFGVANYGFMSDGRIVCAYGQRCEWHLATLDPDSGALTKLDTPYTYLSKLHVDGDSLVFAGASPTQATQLVRLDLTTSEAEILGDSTDVSVDAGYLSVPQTIEFPTEDGLTAHAFYYPPHNMDYAGPANEQPPLLVISHGGPTGAADSAFSLSTQYWCSRGIAVLDVNYGGSTGYGREYRQRLDGRWGTVDVDDCANGARYLVKQGKADTDRLIIRGGSAGGYTTLAALAFRDVFRAGGSYFGVSDPEALAKETHKFESRYLDGLIGPYPERRDLYHERSPIHHVEGLSCPVIFFQGLEDKIVLPNQAEMMVDALRAKGVAVAYLPFEEEQHGFRKSENIKRSLEAELYFYSRVFGFELGEPVAPVEIENLS